MADNIQNDKQFQKDMMFNDFYDEDGNFSKDKLETYLNNIDKSYKDLIQKLVSFSSLIIFLILVISLMFTLLINNGKDNFYVLRIVICAFSILLLIAFEIIPLLSTSVSIQKKYNENLSDSVKMIRKLFYSEVISECQLCAESRTPEPLNVYNLYTYKQIQQIECSLIGPDVEVYCYSRYRDDGGIGPSETDKIVTDNIEKKGIPYHFFYYENSPGDTEPFVPRGRIETYVSLSASNQLKENEAYKQCLDYRIYSNARFDIMIYKRGNSLEGYFCLNFPVPGICQNCQKVYSTRCSLKLTGELTGELTEKLLYKKMPKDITTELFQKLVGFEKKYNKRDI